MKIIQIFTSAFFFIAFFATKPSAHALHVERATFKVYGNCGMCKKTIESALKKNTHIQSADWNVETKMITVVYDPHMISIDEIHALIADAGYNTEKAKASDSSYQKLPTCCQYERAGTLPSKKAAKGTSGHSH